MPPFENFHDPPQRSQLKWMQRSRVNLSHCGKVQDGDESAFVQAVSNMRDASGKLFRLRYTFHLYAPYRCAHHPEVYSSLTDAYLTGIHQKVPLIDVSCNAII